MGKDERGVVEVVVEKMVVTIVKRKMRKSSKRGMRLRKEISKNGGKAERGRVGSEERSSVATWGPTQVARETHKNSQIVAKKYFEVAKKIAKY